MHRRCCATIPRDGHNNLTEPPHDRDSLKQQVSLQKGGNRGKDKGNGAIAGTAFAGAAPLQAGIASATAAGGAPLPPAGGESWIAASARLPQPAIDGPAGGGCRPAPRPVAGAPCHGDAGCASDRARARGSCRPANSSWLVDIVPQLQQRLHQIQRPHHRLILARIDGRIQACAAPPAAAGAGAPGG